MERDDYAPFDVLLNSLPHPFEDQPQFAAFAEPRRMGKAATERSAAREWRIQTTRNF